jgi:AGZA family xanthine/uracil permease-like MFS transporter
MLKSGLAVTDPSGEIAFGHVAQPATLLALGGLVTTPLLIALRLPGALLLSIAVLSIIGLFIPAADGHGYVTVLPTRFLAPPHLPTALFAAYDFQSYAQHFLLLLPVTIYLFVSDFFAATCTFMCIGRRANLMADDDVVSNARRAFVADALSSAAGASLGSATVCAYVESVAGVEAGGRTGLTAVVVAGLFALALFLWPIFAIIPAQATAPTLIIVGVMMMEGIADVLPSKPEDFFPAILVLIITVTTMDLAAGMAIGCFVHTLMLVALRRRSRLTPMLLAIDGVLAVYFAVSGVVR